MTGDVGEGAAKAVLLCLCTCPDAETAGRIAHALVEARLAACVGCAPGLVSVYRWEGRVERAEEVQLVIKTTRARFAALQARLLELHPYRVPELIALDVVGGLPAYLRWVVDETRPDHAPSTDIRPAASDRDAVPPSTFPA